MKLYFLRHASATDIARSDAERALTPRGEAEAQIAGRALLALGVQPGRILTSPLVRAQQTARIAAAAMKFAGAISVHDELLNGTPTSSVLGLIAPFAGESEVLLVGHMPSLGEHVGVLTGNETVEKVRSGQFQVIETQATP